MARKFELEMANFVCRFGENYVLSDLLVLQRNKHLLR